MAWHPSGVLHTLSGTHYGSQRPHHARLRTRLTCRLCYAGRSDLRVQAKAPAGWDRSDFSFGHYRTLDKARGVLPACAQYVLQFSCAGAVLIELLRRLVSSRQQPRRKSRRTQDEPSPARARCGTAMLRNTGKTVTKANRQSHSSALHCSALSRPTSLDVRPLEYAQRGRQGASDFGQMPRLHHSAVRDRASRVQAGSRSEDKQACQQQNEHQAGWRSECVLVHCLWSIHSAAAHDSDAPYHSQPEPSRHRATSVVCFSARCFPPSSPLARLRFHAKGLGRSTFGVRRQCRSSSPRSTPQLSLARCAGSRGDADRSCLLISTALPPSWRASELYPHLHQTPLQTRQGCKDNKKQNREAHVRLEDF